MDLRSLATQLRDFATQRDWDQFHDPKNLAMGLASEVGELIEVFQWKTTDEVRAGVAEEDLAAAAEELADVLIYVVRLSDVLGIDLAEATERKMALNAERYPVEVAKGNATKHDRRLT